MSQTISVSTQMDEQGFRDFAVFDVFRHNKAWLRPAIFCAIMLVFSGVCMSQIGKREGAGLLTAVLASGRPKATMASTAVSRPAPSRLPI